MTSIVLPLALAVIMFTLGLGLTVGDFKRVFVMPKGVLIGLVNLLIISPLLAFAVAEIFNLEPLLAIGLVLLGASPGGTLANMFTHLARGDTALSISMTAISSVVAVLSIPFFLEVANNHFGGGASLDDVDMSQVVLRTFLITVLPLSIGVWTRSRWTRKVVEIRPKLTRLSMVLFVLVVAAAIAADSENIVDNFLKMALATFTLNVAAMSISFTISKLSKLSDRQATAIAIELGIHNATVAIVVAGMINDEMMVPAAVYTTFMFINGGLFARFMNRRNAPRPEVAGLET